MYLGHTLVFQCFYLVPLLLSNNLSLTFEKKKHENSVFYYFWSVNNSVDVLVKLRAFAGSLNSVDGFDFTTLYITLPYNLIK